MLRPRKLLEAFGRAHPGAWDALEDLRRQRADGWPPYVFATMETAGLALVQARVERRLPRPAHVSEILEPASQLPGLAAWRMTQQVYRFDPDLYSALVATPVTGQIPGEYFQRLPAWSVYIETPGLTVPMMDGGREPLFGFFAWLDWRADTREDILTLGLDTDAYLAVGHVPLVGTIEEALGRVEADWRDGLARGNATTAPSAGYATAAREAFGPLLSLLLYLCAERADYSRPPWPTPRPGKRGMRLFPADKPSVWDVGERIGAALRAARAAPAEPTQGTGTGRASPRAHVRGAHWHLFWTGPREGERKPRVLWLPPIGVKVHLGEDLPTVVRPVK